MVTRAYITTPAKFENGAYRCKITVPIFGASMEYSVLKEKNAAGLDAIIACPPNIEPQYKAGDAVIIAFEEYLADSPIVIGWLCGSKDNKGTGEIYSTYSDAVFRDLVVGNRFTMPKSVEVSMGPAHLTGGVVNYGASTGSYTLDLMKLKDLKDSVQFQFDTDKENIEHLKKQLESTQATIVALVKVLESSGILTNGFYSDANYTAMVSDSNPVGALPKKSVQDSLFVPGN